MTRLIVHALAAYLFGFALSSAQAAKVYIEEPRPFGHFIGDVVTRHVTVELEPGEDRVLPASLPRKGPVAYWLELRDITVDNKTAEGGRLSMRLEYQGFYSALQPKVLEIPGFKLRVRSVGGEQSDLMVPAVKVMFSPLREIVPEEKPDDPADALRPDASATPLRERPHRLATLIAAVALGVLSLLLAHRYSVFPFGARRGRPFTRAAREFGRAMVVDDVDDDRYRELLLVMHRAIDEAAGRRVLPTDLNEIASSNAAIDEHRDRVEGFFNASKDAFFSGRTSDARESLPATNLKRLMDDLAAAERRLAI